MISNVEAYLGGHTGEYVVHSVFVNYRSRGETDNDLLLGRREDVLRDGEDGLRIARDRKSVV